MTCLHNHDQILEFLRKIFLKGFQIYQNYLCALMYIIIYNKYTINIQLYICDSKSNHIDKIKGWGSFRQIVTELCLEYMYQHFIVHVFEYTVSLPKIIILTLIEVQNSLAADRHSPGGNPPRRAAAPLS